MLIKYSKIKAAKIEVKSFLELSAKYNVFTVPVVILFIQGKETIKEARIISIQNLEDKIVRYYEMFYN